jgi:hypothetical protein
VIILGATGMVGQGVLRECLLDPDVETVLSIGRHSTQGQHEKLQEIVWDDVLNLSPLGRGLKAIWEWCKQHRHDAVNSSRKP